MAASAPPPRQRDRPFYAHADFEQLYKACKTLGRGAFGETVLAEDLQDKSLWAAKVQHLDAMDVADRENFLLECSVLQALPAHPHLCWTREIFRSAAGTTRIVFELLTGGELFDRIVQKDQYTEAEAVATVRQVADGLRAVHATGVVHRDLKPDNIMYSTMSVASPVKIVDFGLSAYHVAGVDDPLTVPCGTAAYAAPEVLACQGYDQKADIWSLGVITYILLCGGLPFDEEDERELFQQVLSAEVDFSDDAWNDVSDLARDFVTTLMDRDKGRRPHVDEVLAHPWLAGPKRPAASTAAAAAVSAVESAGSGGGGGGGGGGAGGGAAHSQWASSPTSKPLAGAHAKLKKFHMRARLRGALVVARSAAAANKAILRRRVQQPQLPDGGDDGGGGGGGAANSRLCVVS